MLIVLSLLGLLVHVRGDALTTLGASVALCQGTYATAAQTSTPSTICTTINTFNWCLVQAVGESVTLGLSTSQAQTFTSVLSRAFSIATNDMLQSNCQIPLMYSDVLQPVDFTSGVGIYNQITSSDVELHQYQTSSFRIVDLVAQLQTEEQFSPGLTTSLKQLVSLFNTTTMGNDSTTAVNLAQKVVSLVDTVITSLTASFGNVSAVSNSVDIQNSIDASFVALRKTVDNDILNLDNFRIAAADTVYDFTANIIAYTTQDSIDRVTYGTGDAAYLASVTANITQAISSFTASQDAIQVTWSSGIVSLVASASTQANATISSQVSTEVSRATSAATIATNGVSFLQIQIQTGGNDTGACTTAQSGTMYYSSSSTSTGFYYCNSTNWAPFMMTPAPFILSQILDYTRAIRLTNLVKYPTWALCHSSTVNGWVSTTFRNACASRGPTITLARDASQGRIFGGYNAASWLNSSPGGQNIANGNLNFVFRWHNGNFDQFPWNGGSYYTYETTSYGPCFGNSPAYSDLCFNSNMNVGWAYFNYWYYFINFYNYYNCYCGWSGNFMVSQGNTFSVTTLEIWYKV